MEAIDGDDDDDDDDDDSDDGYIFPRCKIRDVDSRGGFGRLLAAAYSSSARLLYTMCSSNNLLTTSYEKAGN